MQVLFRGTPGEQEYTATCSHCNSTMKFEGREIKSAFYNARTSKYITCPVCSSYILESKFVKLSQTKPIVPLSISPEPCHNPFQEKIDYWEQLDKKNRPNILSSELPKECYGRAGMSQVALKNLSWQLQHATIPQLTLRRMK